MSAPTPGAAAPGVARRWLRRAALPVVAALAGAGVVGAVVLASTVPSGPEAGAVTRPGGPGSSGANDAPVPAAPVASCPVAAPDTAAGYQRLFDGLDGDWAGGDQAVSVVLPDGRTLWVFADSITGRTAPDGGYLPGWRIRHSAFVLQDRGCLTAVPGTPLPELGPADWYWPNSAFVVADRLVVLAMRVHRTGPGLVDFAVSGSAVATFALPAGGVPRLLDVVAGPGVPGGTLWGAGVTVRAGWAYVYGTRTEPGAFGRSLSVARVRPSAVDDPAAWTYFDGRGWVADEARAAVLVDAIKGVSTSVSPVTLPDGRTALISKRDEVFGDDVVAWTAPHPWGPFTVRDPALFRAPSLRVPGELVYTPQAHAGTPLRDGRLLVSICRNNLDLRVVGTDAGLYRPQFREVSLTP